MAWNGVQSKQMVSYNAAQEGNITLRLGQSHLVTNKIITKSAMLSKYEVDSTLLTSYADNQLIPKNRWANANFMPLNQTQNLPSNKAGWEWSYITVAPNGDVYATIRYKGIYKQTGGVGDFLPVNEDPVWWNVITAAPNGDIYACDSNGSSGGVGSGQIFKRTGGIGNFENINTLNYIGGSDTTTDVTWTGITAALNGDVYVCGKSSTQGGIYKLQYVSKGNQRFLPYDLSIRMGWSGMTTSPSGDVYAYISNPTTEVTSLHKLINGVFTFVEDIPLEIDNYIIDFKGDEYISVTDGYIGNSSSVLDIFKRTLGSSSFVRLNQVQKNWTGLAATPSGRIYACAYSGDIYIK